MKCTITIEEILPKGIRTAIVFDPPPHTGKPEDMNHPIVRLGLSIAHALAEEPGSVVSAHGVTPAGVHVNEELPPMDTPPDKLMPKHLRFMANPSNIPLVSDYFDKWGDEIIELGMKTAAKVMGDGNQNPENN